MNDIAGFVITLVFVAACIIAGLWAAGEIKPEIASAVADFVSAVFP